MDLVRRAARTLEGGQAPRSHACSPLWVERVRGRARLWGRDLQVDPAFRAPEAVRSDPRFRNPLYGRRDRCRQAPRSREEWAEGRLPAPGRLARLGDDGR